MIVGWQNSSLQLTGMVLLMHVYVKGLQASVIEFKTPGKFFIHIRTVEIMESLRKVTLALQKTYAKTNSRDEYLPAKGEVCAAKYSQDQNWYRGLVQTVDSSLKKVNILYIDFGNEEDVTLDRLQPLSKDIDPLWPSQLQNAKDNQWYRATVLSYTSKDKVCVGYIDFGNCEELNVDRIRPVTEKFLQLPMQAIPCALAGVKPLLGVWTPEAILIMKKLVSSKFLKAKVVGRKERKALIELCDEHSDPQASIAELLIATGYAAAAADEEKERKKHKADSAVKTEDSAPTVALPEKLEWTSAGLPNSQAVDVAVSVLHSPGEFYCQRYIARDLQALNELSVELSRYCRAESNLFTPAVGEPCCAIFPVDMQNLQPLMVELAEYCSSQSHHAELKPKAGVACCARFSGDKNWYRAIVLETFDTAAKVIYADYGNSESVEYSSILPIQEKHLELPFQVVKCALAGDKNWYRAIVLETFDTTAKVIYADYGNSESVEYSSILPIQEKHLELPFQVVKCALAAQRESPGEWPQSSVEQFKTLVQGRKVFASVQEFDGELHTVNLKSCVEDGSVNVAQMIMEDLSKSNSKSTTPESVAQTIVEDLTNCRAAPTTTGDKNWYRAIVLETFDTAAKVIYADYGNSESVEYSSILPIQEKHLELPFQVVKCALAAQRESPGKWLQSPVEQFKTLVQGRKVFASVQEFDGELHIVNLKSCAKDGFVNVAQMIMEDLSKFNSKSTTPESVAQTIVEDLTNCSAAPTTTVMQCSTAVDVLFLLDGSYSIGKGSFERSKHFAFKLCDALDINPERVRVGVIQYSSTPRLEFSLNSYPTKDEVKEQIKKLSFKGGSTQTGQALKYILRKGFPGGRNTTVPRILIVLTDGKSQGTVQPASQLKEEGITIFAVGIKYPRWDELHTLASLPTEQHVLFAEHFNDAVNGLYTTLTSATVCTAVPSDPCDSQPCHNGGTCIPDGLEKYRCVCPVGFGGDPNCAPKLSLDCSVDLLFLVEGSSNVSLEGFLRYKSFMRRFVQAVLTPDTPVNVGLAQYSDDVRMEMKIGEYRDIPELLQSIDGMRYRGGGTRTGKALSYVTQFGFKSTPVFADVQDDLPRVVVLMTDSGSEDSVTEPAKHTRDREIFIIGVGGEFLKEDLNKITGNPQRTITYSSPQHLLSRIPDLRSKICSVDSQGCLAQSLDLVFALDASDGVGNENFYRLRDFVRSTSVQFDINRDVTQIGLVTYGRELRTMFALDTYDSGTSIMQAINQVPYIGGRASTGSALLHIHDNVMTVQKGARPGVNKAVVVITDGAGGDDAAVPSQRIRNNGISVFVVGIGDAQRDALLKIAGSEDHMIPVASYEDLKYFEDVLVQKVCEEAKKAVNLCKPSPCMNDGICALRNGSYRCECRGWEGPHCENIHAEDTWNSPEQLSPVSLSTGLQSVLQGGSLQSSSLQSACPQGSSLYYRVDLSRAALSSQPVRRAPVCITGWISPEQLSPVSLSAGLQSVLQGGSLQSSSLQSACPKGSSLYYRVDLSRAALSSQPVRRAPVCITGWISPEQLSPVSLSAGLQSVLQGGSLQSSSLQSACPQGSSLYYRVDLSRAALSSQPVRRAPVCITGWISPEQLSPVSLSAGLQSVLQGGSLQSSSLQSACPQGSSLYYRVDLSRAALSSQPVRRAPVCITGWISPEQLSPVSLSAGLQSVLQGGSLQSSSLQSACPQGSSLYYRVDLSRAALSSQPVRRAPVCITGWISPEQLSPVSLSAGLQSVLQGGSLQSSSLQSACPQGSSLYYRVDLSRAALSSQPVRRAPVCITGWISPEQLSPVSLSAY
ncbi:UNVERIFIED_CONTAM: hypothetical protein FKN15_045781 [Acipenser sinensis]